MSIYISFSLNIYHVIHLVLWASHCQSSKWHAFNKTMLRRAAFLIIWTGSSKQDTTPFTKGTKGKQCVKFGQEAKGKPCTWNLRYHALGVCHPKQNTITYFNRATTNIYENHIKIHRIMNGLKECIWKQRDPITHLLATECLNHTQNKLKLFTMFPNFLFSPLHLTIKKDLY